jgi:hypothetical protein
MFRAPLPATYYGVLLAFVVTYLACVEVAKLFFFKEHPPTAARPLQRRPEHRVHRIAAAFSHHRPVRR